MDRGLIVPEREGVRVIARPGLATGDRVDAIIAPGWSVDEIVGHLVEIGAISRYQITLTRVWIVDEKTATSIPVPFDQWRFVRPKLGSTVAVGVVYQRGGGGGGGGKSPIRIIASLAVMAVAAWAGPAILGAFPSLAATLGNVGLALGLSASAAMSFAGFVVGGAISLVGNALISAIIPMGPQSNASRQNYTGGSYSPTPVSPPTYAITGLRNRVNPYGPVPRLLGQRRVFPIVAANSYTEVVGNDQYLRAIFSFGYGPLLIEDIKIGETPIGSYPNVEYEVRQGFDNDADLTLFTRSVNEENLSVSLTNATGWQTRRTRTNTDEISVDTTCPRGLTKFESNGTRSSRTVDVAVEYRLVGDVAWTSAGTIAISDNSTSAVRRSLRWTVANGQYEVRLQRSTADSTEAAIVDLVIWSQLRSITTEHPINLSGLALIAVRIKATDSLNGTLDSLNAICTAMLPTYDGAAWTEPVATRNPAWAYCEVFRGSANKRPVSDAQLDLDAIKAWADACDAASPQGDGPMWTYDAVIDSRTSVDMLIRQICAAGRARYYVEGRKRTVVQDEAQASPVFYFTPRNSNNFKMSRQFPQLPHGLKCRWVNPEIGYQEDERIVYANGYDAMTATLFEQVDMLECTRPQQVYREARYHQAAAKLRPATYELSTDIENLAVRPGDLVGVAYDTPMWGLNQARLASVALDGGGNCTGVTLDAPVTMATGENYSLLVRLADGETTATGTVVTAAGSTKTLTFSPSIPQAALMPAAGDMVMFGRVGQTHTRLIVKDIMRGEDITARIVFVDEAPAVHTSYTGTIPAFVSQISQPVPIEQQAPPRPNVVGYRSDETAMLRASDGTLIPRILIDIAPTSSSIWVESLQIQYRVNGSGSWSSLPVLPGDATEAIVFPVIESESYDIRLRAISRLGVPSDYFLIEDHTVVGKTSLPPDVTQVRINGSLLSWSYSAPVDHKGFRVRHRAGSVENWSDSTSAHDADVITVQEIDLSGLPGGLRTIMVKAVDILGNESANAGLVVLNLGDTIPANVIATTDYAALGFPGTITNGTVSGGNLVADDDGGLYLPNGSATYLPTGGDLYLPTSYLEMTWELSFTPALTDLPSSITIAETIAADSWDIQYRRQGGGLYLSDGAASYLSDGSALYLGGPDPWAAWPGSLAITARETVDFKVRTSAGSSQGTVSEFAINLDVPDIEESLDDVVIAATTGTRLPITKSYRVITQVLLTLQADGNGATTARIEDKDADLGPLIKTLAAGSAVAGLVDARIKGYGP